MPPEAQRHRNYQAQGQEMTRKVSARKIQSPKGCPVKQGRHHRQQYGGNDHCRGIHAGEAGDEVFRPGLLRRGIFHQIQNAGHRGFPTRPADPDLQATGGRLTPPLMTASPSSHPGEPAPCQGGGIQGGMPYSTVPVQWGRVRQAKPQWTGPPQSPRGSRRSQLAVFLHVGVIGTDIHQGGDGTARTAHRMGLEQLAHPDKTASPPRHRGIPAGRRRRWWPPSSKSSRQTPGRERYCARPAASHPSRSGRIPPDRRLAERCPQGKQPCNDKLLRRKSKSG